MILSLLTFVPTIIIIVIVIIVRTESKEEKNEIKMEEMYNLSLFRC